MSGIKLLLDSSRGQYIPRDFVQMFKIAGFGGLTLNCPNAWQNVTPWAYHVCATGPDSPDYWDAWDGIYGHATCTDENGNVWVLYQDGDLFLICPELMTDAEKSDFGYEG